jgi:glutamate formiminotransferase
MQSYSCVTADLVLFLPVSETTPEEIEKTKAEVGGMIGAYFPSPCFLTEVLVLYTYTYPSNGAWTK